MKKDFFVRQFCVILACVLFISLMGCGGETQSSPEKKATLSRASTHQLTIYDILSDYQGLENFFTYGDLEIQEFEQRLFGNFLGEEATADIIVSMIDLFPILIDTGADFETREVAQQTFSSEIEEEMESKGPVPDLLANLGVITQKIIEVEEDKKLPFYDYLDDLNELENKDTDSKGTMEYILDILVDISGYLDTLDDEDINLFMDFSAEDKMEMQISADGSIDFADVDELFEKWVTESPEGVIEILEATKALFYDDDFKDTLKTVLNRLAIFLGDDQVYAEVKALFENIYAEYDVDSLGELVDRFWDKGAIIGPGVEELGIEDYGKDGVADSALRKLLQHPKIITDFLETVHMFEEYGISFDKVDDHLAKMVNTNPFCFDRKGEGELGNGEFYQPTESFSFKNFSNFRAAATIFNRWNMPFTPTAPWLYENGNTQNSKEFFRKLMPTVDSMSLSPSMYMDMYEKDPDKLMGGGKPVTEKGEYGVMKNGVWAEPIAPALITAGCIPFYTMGFALYNGPYDNIYDNLNWHYYQHNMYAIIDLIQFSPYVPALKTTVLPFLKLLGYETFPVTIMHIQGAMNLINLEVSTIIKNLPSVMSNDLVKANLPEWMVNLIIEAVKKIIPFACPVEGEPKVYVLSRDVRDMANIVWALSYYDPKAFHLDRFLDEANPENYHFFYDSSEYTYEKNKDVANHVFDIAGALFVSAYLTYRDVVAGYPLTMEGVEERQEAAKEALGIIYPASYLFNMFSPFYGHSTETPAYDLADSEVYPLARLMEPLITLDSADTLDAILKLVSILGKQELEDARDKLFSGIAKLAATVEEDSETPYTLATEILNIAEKAAAEPERWDALKLSMDYFSGIWDEDSEFEIVEDLIGLLDHLTSVDVSDDDWHAACEGIVEVIKGATETRSITRARYHQATIVNEINKLHIWGDAIDVINEMLKDDGILSYVIRGMEKDPDIPWEEVLEDTNRFLHSKLVTDYEEESFWKDMYYLLDFLADTINASQE